MKVIAILGGADEKVYTNVIRYHSSRTYADLYLETGEKVEVYGTFIIEPANTFPQIEATPEVKKRIL